MTVPIKLYLQNMARLGPELIPSLWGSLHMLWTNTQVSVPSLFNPQSLVVLKTPCLCSYCFLHLDSCFLLIPTLPWVRSPCHNIHRFLNPLNIPEFFASAYSAALTMELFLSRMLTGLVIPFQVAPNTELSTVKVSGGGGGTSSTQPTNVIMSLWIIEKHSKV